jgi:DNA-binding protein YbaB
VDDHRAQVEEMLADYRRSREQLASVQRELKAVTGSASSPDGTVTATVGPKGTLTSLELTDQAYRKYRPEQLAELIVRTAGAAAAKAAENTHKALSSVLPSSTDPEALVNGTADLRPDEIAPPEPVAAVSTSGSRRRRDHIEDDEDFEQRDSWLDSELINRRSR